MSNGSASPVMMFLMSLVSSLFLHSSKPVTVAAFDRDGQEEVSVVKAEGGTEKLKKTQMTHLERRYKLRTTEM